MQQLLVSLILIVCVAYVARRIWRRLNAPASCHGDHCARCEGCPLADSCQHRSAAGGHPMD